LIQFDPSNYENKFFDSSISQDYKVFIQNLMKNKKKIMSKPAKIEMNCSGAKNLKVLRE
jgi:hypothetical protein